MHASFIHAKLVSHEGCTHARTHTHIPLHQHSSPGVEYFQYLAPTSHPGLSWKFVSTEFLQQNQLLSDPFSLIAFLSHSRGTSRRECDLIWAVMGGSLRTCAKEGLPVSRDRAEAQRESKPGDHTLPSTYLQPSLALVNRSLSISSTYDIVPSS